MEMIIEEDRKVVRWIVIGVLYIFGMVYEF
jgi:hypothetical protein